MAYVPGFEYDVFVSYAHVDDKLPRPRGWVSGLVDVLETVLAQKLGRREYFSLFFDRDALEGQQHEDVIIEKVRRSAVLIVILSNGFVEAKYCHRELGTFVSSRADPTERIFVARMSEPHEREKIPATLDGLIGYQFFDPKTDTTYGLETSQENDEKFNTMAHAMARQVAKRLRALRETLPSKPELAAAPPAVFDGPRSAGHGIVPMAVGATVFLAEVTADLEFEREKIRTFLDQAGIATLPAKYYPQNPGFAEPFERDLSRSNAFVQLLSEYAGKRTDEAPDGYPALQLKLASAHALPKLLWRDPALDLRKAEVHQRSILQSAEASSLADFMQRIVATLRQQPEKVPVEANTVFIDHDRKDETTARAIAEALCKCSIPAEIPSYDEEETVESLREQRKRMMLGHDSVVFIYGDVTVKWINGELKEFMKVRHERSRWPRAQIVLEAPPEGKQEPTVYVPGVQTIKAVKGIDARIIDQLKSELLKPSLMN